MASNHTPPPPVNPRQEWQGTPPGALSQEWRGTPTTTGSESQPGIAGNRTQEPLPGVARDHPQHTPATPKPTPAASPSQGNKPPHATHAPTHAEDTPTPTPPPQTHNAHTSRRRATNTHNTANPPTNPAEMATTGRLQQGVAGNRTQDPQPGMARGHRPATPAGPPARNGGGPHPGPSSRSGEGTPTQDPQTEARTTPHKPADLSQ